jgi:tetratricopeptide (TPR) repeat protein
MPLDPADGTFARLIVRDAEINLGLVDAAIEAYRKALDVGLRQFFVHSNLAAACALGGKMDEAKAEPEEARRLNPAITIRWEK